MYQIGELKLYIGTKEEYQEALSRKMKIVCAMNRCNGYISHQSVVGWSGQGCNKDNPYYLYKKDPDAIYLNLIDGDNPDYIDHRMINSALIFINDALEQGDSVFVYCSRGQSRAPSIALMYLLEKRLIERNPNTTKVFRKKYYPVYNPNAGVFYYIKKRWKVR